MISILPTFSLLLTYCILSCVPFPYSCHPSWHLQRPRAGPTPTYVETLLGSCHLELTSPFVETLHGTNPSPYSLQPPEL